MLPRDAGQRLAQVEQLPGQEPHVVAQVQPQVGGDLVVAAAPRPQLAAEGSEPFQQAALERGVHVLVVYLRPERSRAHRGGELIERADHEGQLALVEQAGARAAPEHGPWRPADRIRRAASRTGRLPTGPRAPLPGWP